MAKLSSVAAVAALAMFGAAGRDDALKLKAVVGDSHSYTITAEMGIGTQTGKLNGKMVDQVIKVEDDGRIKLKETQSNMHIEFGGQSMDVPDRVSYVTKNLDDTTSELGGDDVSAALYRLDAVNTIKFPDEPLAKDKAWAWDLPANSKTGVVKTHGDFKVLGDETLHGIDTWKISTKIQEMEGDEPASTEGTVWISKKDGMMVKATGKGANLPYPGAPAPVSGTETIDLITS